MIDPSVEAVLFVGEDPVGRTLTLASECFQIIVVMEPKGQLFDSDRGNQVFVPLSTAQRVLGATTLSLIYVHVPQADDIPGGMAEVGQLLEKA